MSAIFATTNLPKNVQAAFPQAVGVIDADEPIMINIMHEDVQGAESYSEINCAAARACKKMYGVDGAFIGRTVSYLLRGTILTRYRTPPSLTEEETSFDRHGDFAVGNYRLSAMSGSHKMGSDHKREKTNSGIVRTRKGSTIPKHYTVRTRGRG